jgi:hypothetical protein
MFNYTYQNHFKFGYAAEDQAVRWFDDRTDRHDRWTVKYGQQKEPIGSFRQECIRAAELIYENRQGLPIDVMFSGGSDSELVLRSFLELGVDFRVHIMRYDDYLNAHDWSYAYVICQNLNIKPVFHDLNLLDFWKSSEFYDYVEDSKCVTPQLISHMWLMNRLDGLGVMGSGECYTARMDIVGNRTKIFTQEDYSKHVPWVLYEREKIASWYRFPMARNLNIVPAFCQYTPGIILSFLTDSLSIDLHNNKIVGKMSNKSSKFSIYKKYWPELIDRKKWSGFEKVLDEDRVIRRELRKLFPYHEFEYWSEVNYLVDYMTGQEPVMPVNFSPPVTNPGMRNVKMDAIKKDLGDYLD